MDDARLMDGEIAINGGIVFCMYVCVYLIC